MFFFSIPYGISLRIYDLHSDIQSRDGSFDKVPSIESFFKIDSMTGRLEAFIGLLARYVF